MSDENKFNNDIAIADLLIRLKSLENLLIRNKIILQHEFDEEISSITSMLVQAILPQEKDNLDS